MWIENRLTDDDMMRAHDIGVSPLLLAGAHCSLLQAVVLLCDEVVVPVIQERKPWNDRQTAFIGLFYRLIGFYKTTVALNNIVHQQSLTSAERSALELLIDMKLLHNDVSADGIDRFFAFAQYQRLRAARRVDRFFQDNPSLDDGAPSKATSHRQFIAREGDRIDAQSRRFWPRPDGRAPKPEHWTGMDMPQRAKKLDSQAELAVLEGYDMRNFAVHTGIAGIMNLERSAFEAMCAQALTNTGRGALEALRIIGAELSVHETVDVYDRILADLDALPVYAMADQILRTAGEAQRYFLHPGHWPGDRSVER
jgi:hypothetical protein